MPKKAEKPGTKKKRTHVEFGCSLNRRIPRNPVKDTKKVEVCGENRKCCCRRTIQLRLSVRRGGRNPASTPRGTTGGCDRGSKRTARPGVQKPRDVARVLRPSQLARTRLSKSSGEGTRTVVVISGGPLRPLELGPTGAWTNKASSTKVLQHRVWVHTGRRFTPEEKLAELSSRQKPSEEKTAEEPYSNLH